jgi:quercetin dioxygenase-like cupin family protein
MTVPVASSDVAVEEPFSSLDAPRRIASIIRPGEGQRIGSFGNDIEFMRTAEQTAGSLTLGAATVPAGNGPPAHVHSREDELFIIAEGEYRVYLDGEWTTVGPGSVVYLPRGSTHTFQVVGPAPGKHWVLTTPSGFERFFARTSEVFAAPGPPDFARIAAINAEFGVAFADTR